MPKGVEYSQEMIYAHSLMAIAPTTFDISESDVVMPVVPMFHVNGWELPYAVTMTGAKQVYPGPSPSAADLADLIETEGITFTAGVPTVWINLLEHAAETGADLSALERILTGGSAVPESVMRRYEEEHDVVIEHARGDDRDDERRELLAPEVDHAAAVHRRGSTRSARNRAVVARTRDEGYRRRRRRSSDGTANRSANCTSAARPSSTGTTTGRRRTEPISGRLAQDRRHRHGRRERVHRDRRPEERRDQERRQVDLHDRTRERIDETRRRRQAAVVGVPDDRWQERPLACVVSRPDATVDAEELRNFLSDQYPRWWLPDEFVFADEVPKTATGKFDKKVVRDEVRDADLRWTPGK